MCLSVPTLARSLIQHMEAHFEHAACHGSGIKHGCTAIRGRVMLYCRTLPTTISLLETFRCLRFVIPLTPLPVLLAPQQSLPRSKPETPSADRLFRRVCAHTRSCRTCREQIGRFLRVAQHVRYLAKACVTFHTYLKGVSKTTSSKFLGGLKSLHRIKT